MASYGSAFKKALGLQPIPLGQPIRARFSSFEIFRVSGFVPKPERTVDHAFELDGVSVRIKIAHQILAVVPPVLNWTVEDSCEFEKDKNCHGPYASLLIGPLAEVSSEEPGWFKAQQRLVVRDWHIVGSGVLTVSKPEEAEIISGRLERGLSRIQSINRVAATYFHAACQEPDALKRFLFFFLALEQQMNALYESHSRVTLGQKKLAVMFKELSTSILAHVDSEDTFQLKSLIDVRNAIAHGRCLVPKQSEVVSVERLARKILLGRGDAPS